MPKRPTLKVIERQNRLTEYLARGMTEVEMAKLENVSQPTISQNVAAIKERIWDEVAGKDITPILTLIKTNQEANLKELWDMKRKTVNESVKLGCIKQINNLISETIELYQKLGIVVRAPERIEISSYEDVKKSLEEAYADAKNRYNVNSKHPEVLPPEVTPALKKPVQVKE